MSRPFSLYRDSFDGNTLSYHRFGERGGRLDGVIGPAMAIGAGAPVPTDRGYLLAAGDLLQATGIVAPARTQGTIECWFRYDGAEGDVKDPVTYLLASANQLFIRLWRGVGTGSINAVLYVGNVGVGYAAWSGAAARAMLDSPDLIHVAATFDSDAGYCRLFVNGVQRAEDLVGILPLPEGTYRVRILTAVGFLGLVDEVRASAISRYVGGANGTRYFWPARFQDGRRAVVRGPEMRAGLTAGVIQ